MIDSRRAGLLVPLFSLRSPSGWGIGEIPDIGGFASWMRKARLSVLALLPLHESALGQESPYFALSAFAIDPIHLSLAEIEDFEEIGGEECLSPEERAELEEARASETVRHGSVRRLKMRALLRCFGRFEESGAADSRRGRELASFREEEREWLQDYALFRALKEVRPDGWWREWSPALRDRQGPALAEAAADHRKELSFFEYLQWQAFSQLRRARASARSQGVSLLGDLPFTVAEDSVDVWTRQDEFSLDATVGSPPDAYASDGQDWGLPSYRWEVIRAGGYRWLRQRARLASKFFDAVRVDHAVGLYRTFTRPKDGSPPSFLPATEEAQREQGEAILMGLREGGAELLAEDLGTVPPFVRASLARLGVPGYRVLRWEKDGDGFRDPMGWPNRSVATTGTHDTEPLAIWWESMGRDEREALHVLPPFRSLASASFTDEVHEGVFRAMYASGSSVFIPPIQDVFGLRDRINLPGTVGAHNWAYRLPWTLDGLHEDPLVRRKAELLSRLAAEHGRG